MIIWNIYLFSFFLIINEPFLFWILVFFFICITFLSKFLAWNLFAIYNIFILKKLSFFFLFNLIFFGWNHIFIYFLEILFVFFDNIIHLFQIFSQRLIIIRRRAQTSNNFQSCLIDIIFLKSLLWIIGQSFIFLKSLIFLCIQWLWFFLLIV